MDKYKIQKASKILVSTVFAASGMALVMPTSQQAVAATSPFKDLTPYDSHYDTIMNLYSQGAINGYPDQTFRPNNHVTRGQAAKMLAIVLGLKLNNVNNPHFSDVPISDEYYKYIAALANEGIMSGYSNGTFMPHEVITRGQLAKILVLGFKFEVATSYNHDFIDVTSKTSHASYIQTLVDLEITKGTTPVTFSPYNALTRGQIASFLVRAQEKKANPASYKITGIADKVVYINAVPYTIPSNLQHIFNEDNKDVLNGAVIEGTFKGKQLTDVSKLILNASGTNTNFLELNGGNGSFGANIVVNGNYIRFVNVNLTGKVYINETIRPPLTNNSAVNFSLQKSNLGRFVNWTEESLTMKAIERYVKFYNSVPSHVVLSKNATKIESNKTLPRVDIEDDVREFEIVGDITLLNLHTETKLTMYGESNIFRINYNSLTDLEMYFKGRIGTLYVDNVYGRIDIGDYTYIDRVILPKDESPNTIFDDYLEDYDNMGVMTDPDGNLIDKNPVENQKPVDKTSPLVSITNVELVTSSTIKVGFTSNELGTYYYIVRDRDANPPTKAEMVNRLSSENVASGTGTAIAGNNTITATNLAEKKEYVVYVMVVDGANNVSDIVSQSFQMKDGSAPVVKSLTINPLRGGKRANMTFVASEPGEYFYYIRPKTSAPNPTTKDIIESYTGKGQAKSGELSITEMINGLTPETTYQIYVVMKDESGNVTIDPPVSKEFTTTEPDTEHPYVKDMKLLPTGKDNQFYFTVNEALDPATARDVNNYELSGTVIVNTTGQKHIKPSAVEYKEGDTKVLLTIPSQTGFVLGDTLRVTVLPSVKDLADNPFISAATVTEGSPVLNYAEYTHTKYVLPVMKIVNIVRNPDTSNGYYSVEVEFEPNKAGTYYYMVVPDTIVDGGVTKSFAQYIADKGITERDFVDEFASDASLHSGKFKINNKEIYIESGSGAADLEAKTKKFPIKIQKDTLNPFLSYSVYMVLKDRGGEVSKMVSQEIVGDMKAPLIRNIVVKPKENDDTKAEISFYTNETTKLHYWFVPKKNEDGTPNPDVIETIDTPAERKELETKLKASPSVTKIGNGVFSLAEAKGVTLTPHTEYVVYLGAEDTFGNMSVHKANAAGNDHDETNTGWMKLDFYSDGTAPRFESTASNGTKQHLVYRNPNGTFTISFSEAIMRNETGISEIPAGAPYDLANILTISDEEGQKITSDFQFVSYTIGEKTTDQSKLIIKPSSVANADKTFTVRMNESTKDHLLTGYTGHTFDLNDFGQYVYPGAIVNSIGDAVVTGTNLGTTSVPASKTMRAVVYIEAALANEQRYYYAVTGSVTTIDPELVINLTKDPNTPNNTILAYGTDLLAVNSPAGKQFTLNLTAPSSNIPGYDPIFTKGNNFFLFTVDMYGNIVWAVDPNDPSKKYFKLGSNIPTNP